MEARRWQIFNKYVQIDLAANFAAMAEAGPSQESPPAVAENWCFTQVTTLGIVHLVRHPVMHLSAVFES